MAQERRGRIDVLQHVAAVDEIGLPVGIALRVKVGHHGEPARQAVGAGQVGRVEPDPLPHTEGQQRAKEVALPRADLDHPLAPQPVAGREALGEVLRVGLEGRRKVERVLVGLGVAIRRRSRRG